MRHLHATDVRFLESFHDQGVARATPINTIAVLSRADEIGVGRLDALNSARRIARRYRADDKIRGLCQTVVAVAGLLAQTGRTMRQQEFAALTALAALPRTELDGDAAVGRPVRRGWSPGAGPRRAGAADRPVRPVRGAAGGHADPPGRHRPDRAGRRARAPQRARRPALAAHHAVRRAAGPAQGALGAAGGRPGADAGAAARRRAAGRRDGADPGGRARVRRAAAAGDDPGRGGEAAARRARRRRSGCSAATAAPRRPGWASTRTRRPPSCRRPRWTRRAGGSGGRRARMSSRAVSDIARLVVRSCEGILADLPR